MNLNIHQKYYPYYECSQKIELRKKVRCYVSLACIHCHDKKTKYSGEKPCTNCKRCNHECTYIKPTKKRGPKPKIDKKSFITPTITNLLNPVT